MPRIRSLHPGFFTDEKIVTVSAFARLLFLGVLTECDDNGVFEWKPVTLKMRLFPVDSVEIGGLLGELVAIDAIARTTIDGRDCGIVRNFCKFQRPKKPHMRFPFPNQFRTYVGIDGHASEPASPSDDDSSEPPPHNAEHSTEPVPHQFPTSSELSPQMEEDLGGKEVEGEKGRKKENPNTNNSSNSARASLRSAGSGSGINSNGNGKTYAFEAGVIRLSKKHFDQWKQAYFHLSLEAELIALQDWAAKQENWFVAVSAALAKKQREAVLAIERVKAEAAAGHATAKREAEQGDKWW